LAAAHWEAALALMADGDGDSTHRARLLERLGDLLFVAGLDYRQGISRMEQALQLHESSGSKEDSAQVHARLGRALSSVPETWDIPRSLMHFRAAQDSLAQAPETSALGVIQAGLAQADIWGVHIEDGLASSLAAMNLAERIGDEALWAHAAVIHGGHLCSSGRLASGQELMERAWQRANRLNDPLTFFASFLGSAYASWLGDQPRAQAWSERELAHRRLGQAPGERRRFLSRLASSYALSGHVAHASGLLADVGASYDTWPVLFWMSECDHCERIARERVEASRRGGDRAFAFEATYYLAHLARVRGDREAALPTLERVLDIPVNGGEVAYELAARGLLTLLCAELGHVQESERHLQRCREIMSNGEDWHGLGAWASLARVCCWRPLGACAARVRTSSTRSTGFASAASRGARRRRCTFGSSLAGGRDGAASSEKFGGAADVYVRHGAGRVWVARLPTAQQRPAGLSKREVEVLRLIAAGRTNHEIARELSISVYTAMRHVSNIFTKTGVANRAEAATFGHRHGLT
jgi:DNA-binding CsgD family transcriptional regulator/tetratricopeptide (TPR) repeat protein